MAPSKPGDLFPGEQHVLRKNANAVIGVREAGLSRLPFDGLRGAVGMRGKEAIGGRLHLTNLRLVFRSHAVNRVRGTFSVFLPCVEEVRNTSSGITRRVTVSTAGQDFTFVVWGVPRLIDTVDRYRAGFDDAHLPEVAAHILAEPWKVGDGLRRSGRPEPLGAGPDCAYSRGGDFAAIAADLARGIDPRSARTEVAGVLQVVELLTRAAGTLPPRS
ncbi:hypothetical protein [Streptomyces prasinopilosus]|uniref:hypothetical protein n=1 Tax=Streptomyces prasinopilosus TaxID=67344 RepID=UPI0006EB9982|nr:hypothetical protein [Streptomyces prasinopilosus]